MMARVATELKLPFFSEETARWSTDKFQMKQRFVEGNVPCAKGRLVSKTEDVKGLDFPLIVKPRDNSGSRGVKLCRSKEELQGCLSEAFEVSKLDSVLVEEVIEGQEYSIESLHYEGKTEVLQFTEKKTTEFPYNVELGHRQPANLTDDQKQAIRDIIGKIAACMKFENCPSHTELKINDHGIFVIETSPRLGGDYITSTLVPLSTGINMEDCLLDIAMGQSVDVMTGRVDRASGVCFFSLPEGTVKRIDPQISEISSWSGVKHFNLKLHEGDRINKITSSLNRYGEFIVDGRDRREVDERLVEYEKVTFSYINIY
jgi:carbamoyl-phosphate synthase large subunit